VLGQRAWAVLGHRSGAGLGHRSGTVLGHRSGTVWGHRSVAALGQRSWYFCSAVDDVQMCLFLGASPRSRGNGNVVPFGIGAHTCEW